MDKISAQRTADTCEQRPARSEHTNADTKAHTKAHTSARPTTHHGHAPSHTSTHPHPSLTHTLSAPELVGRQDPRLRELHRQLHPHLSPLRPLALCLPLALDLVELQARQPDKLRLAIAMARRGTAIRPMRRRQSLGNVLLASH